MSCFEPVLTIARRPLVDYRLGKGVHAVDDTLVGRGKIYEEIACDHRLLAILDRLLAPNYLLSADHAICIYPGEKAHALHFDDGFYPFPRPRPAISISVIGAIDPFTPENGGTVLYRGSHKWSSERIEAV